MDCWNKNCRNWLYDTETGEEITFRNEKSQPVCEDCIEKWISDHMELFESLPLHVDMYLDYIVDYHNGSIAKFVKAMAKRRVN